MIRHHGNRARLGGVLLVVALGAAAMLALPGMALTKDRDGDHPRAAGTIESFDPETHLLTIDLADAGAIEGLVVRRTRIRCGDVSRGHQRRRRARHRRHRRLRQASVSHRRDRELEKGDDRSGEDELGDDRGDDGERRGRNEVRGDSEDHRGRHDGSRCVDALVEGATVMRAEMVLAHGKAFYKTIGVLPPPAAETE